MIYLDNQATTPVDPRVLEVLMPMLSDSFANAGSITHEAGRQVGLMVADAIESIAAQLGAAGDEIVITSGATESNSLALIGYATHPRQTRRKIISSVAEHRAVLDPLRRLEQSGFQVTLLPVQQNDQPLPGSVNINQLADVIDDQTCLVTIMLGNNEIGTLQRFSEIAELCRRYDVALHIDATQAVGKVPIDVEALDVDLLSFSAHKFYGPKGVGALYVRSSPRRIRVHGQILGGGQQGNRRAGTLNSPGIVAMAKALSLCSELAEEERPRLAALRNQLFVRLQSGIPALTLNGPRLDDPHARLAGNLNCGFMPVEGQSLMMAVPELAVSSGSACTSSEPRPSHVLRSLGLSDEAARSSLRFGIGRFTTSAEVDQAADALICAHQSLRQLI